MQESPRTRQSLLLIIFKSLIGVIVGAVLVHQTVKRMFPNPDLISAEVLSQHTSIWRYLSLDVLNASIPISASSFVEMTSVTLGLVFIAVVWSTVFSLIIGYFTSATPHRRIWDFVYEVITFGGVIPWFVAGVLTFAILLRCLEDLPNIVLPLPTQIVIGGAILGTFECMLVESIRNFQTLFGGLRRRTYYLARLARGQSTVPIIWRAVSPYLEHSLALRLSYIISGAVIIEKALSIPGLGVAFAEYFTKAKSFNLNEFDRAVLLGFTILVIPILSSMAVELIRWSRIRAATVHKSREVKLK